jgi:hypothetical protein
MAEEQRDEIRNYVRRAALAAATIDQLLTRGPARKVIGALNKEISSSLNAKILGSAP